MPPPPPPLEAWPAIDDALLRLAIESGVAVEALSGARACVEFVSGHKEAAEVRGTGVHACAFCRLPRRRSGVPCWLYRPQARAECVARWELGSSALGDCSCAPLYWRV